MYEYESNYETSLIELQKALWKFLDTFQSLTSEDFFKARSIIESLEKEYNYILQISFLINLEKKLREDISKLIEN